QILPLASEHEKKLSSRELSEALVRPFDGARTDSCVSIAPLGASADDLRLRAARRRGPAPWPARLLRRGSGRRDHFARQRRGLAATRAAAARDGRLQRAGSLDDCARPAPFAPGD